MPFTLTMPKLSPTMEEGMIAKWCKKEGDFVKSGELIFEVATDKATVEHSVLDDGWLRKILVKEGQSAIVNQAVAVFSEKKDESIEGYQPEGLPPKSSIRLPEAQPLAEEDPAASVRAAAVAGLQQPAFVPEPPLKAYQFPVPQAAVEGRRLASPLARKLAKEKRIDIATVRGSGPQGRIMSRDLDLGQQTAAVAFGCHEIPSEAPGSYEEIPLTPMRKIIAQRLQESKTFIPHFYVTQEISADRVVQLHGELKDNGIKVSFNDFVIRAAALALREHPIVNSGFNTVNGSVVLYKTIDISIAVSLETGLITPIIRHADYKNLGQISAEMKSLAARARDGKLSREEYAGGSFTISNLGMYGVSEFTAVINPPQSAILAVAGIEDRVVVRQGQVVAGKTMRLTLSADHRVVDGVDAAKFLKTLQKYLESPSILVM